MVPRGLVKHSLDIAVKIQDSRLLVKQITLHNVGKLHAIGWDIKIERWMSPKEEGILPADGPETRVTTQLLPWSISACWSALQN